MIWAFFLDIGWIAILAFYVAANLGANDVANSMGTSVGSKALTLRQAIILAGILELAGAILFGEKVSQTLTTGIINTEILVGQPYLFVAGMVCVLLASGVWLQIATSKGWPVSSSHAVVGAIVGISSISAGLSAVDWSTVGLISVTWLATPVVSGTIAAIFYSLLQIGILKQAEPIACLRPAIPIISIILMSVFGSIVLFPVFSSDLVTQLLTLIGLKTSVYVNVITVCLSAIVLITLIAWQLLKKKELENQTKELKAEPLNIVEWLLGRLQIMSACFVAFAHGSNDVGNAVAPLAAIAYVRQTGNVPIDQFDIPLWVLILGGAGLVTGLALWGKNVIATVGEGIISLQPSAGFCAELATATTVLMASRLGLPVSTSHALVGGVIGIGLLQGLKSVRYQTVISIGLAWLVTIPVACFLSAGSYLIANYFWDF